MKSASEWLEQELSSLVKEAVISDVAADTIRSRYEIASASRSNMAQAIFTGFGAVMVALGIIAILAYNWEALPRAGKALIAFILLFSAQGFALFTKIKRADNAALAEAAAIFLPSAFTAALAIIAQTYHLGGDLVQFSITVIALALPSLYLIKSTGSGIIFLIAISALLCYLYGNTRYAESYTDLTIAWIYFFAWLPWYIIRLIKDRYSYSTKTLNMLFAIAVIAIANSYLGGYYTRGLELYNSILLASFWAASVLIYPNERRMFWRPVEEIAKAVIVIMLMIFSFESLFVSNSHVNLPQVFYIIIMLYFALIGFFAYKIAKDRLYELIIPLSPFLFYTALHAQADMSFFFTFFSLLGAIAFIFGGIKRLDFALANQGSVWFAILILLKFFQSDVSFLIKGAIFVVMGSALIVFSRYIHKLIKGDN